MLRRFGIRHYAYLGTIDAFGLKPDVNTSQLDVDAEISAMKRNGIDVRAWYFWFNADDPVDEPRIAKTFEAFERHQVDPQIWLPQAFSPSSKNPLDPTSEEGFPTDAAGQQRRVNREADRIAAFSRLAAPYGCKVNLYNHRGWYGLMANQLAILDRLGELGIADVGLVYNIGHSLSADHDDAKAFSELWKRIHSHVVTLNVIVWGFRELEMLRTIHESGWQGAVGVESTYGNAEFSIANALWSLEWAVSV